MASSQATAGRRRSASPDRSTTRHDSSRSHTTRDRDRTGSSRHEKRRRYSSEEDDDRPRYRQSTRARDDDNLRRRRHRSRSTDAHDADRDRRRRPPRSRSRSPPPRSKAPLPSQASSFALTTGGTTSPPPVEKQAPNFAPSGLLAKEANTITTSRPSAHSSSHRRQIVLKYHEPPEARRPPPSQAWRLFRFAEGKAEPDDTILLGERSCWLFGREAGVCDVVLPEGGGAGRQHAVVQFRHSSSRDEFGERVERVRPYVIDLESKAGTVLNGERIGEGRYVELRDGDVLVFGEEGRSGEEWVVMLPPP